MVAVRETPLSGQTLRHLVALDDAGAVVLPASPAFYAGAHHRAGAGGLRGRSGAGRGRGAARALPALGGGAGRRPGERKTDAARSVDAQGTDRVHALDSCPDSAVMERTGGSNLMDAVDRQLIQALRENGRASYAELGRLVGLSGPSVTDRINRLEQAGVITGYRATVAPASLGLGRDRAGRPPALGRRRPRGGGPPAARPGRDRGLLVHRGRRLVHAQGAGRGRGRPGAAPSAGCPAPRAWPGPGPRSCSPPSGRTGSGSCPKRRSGAPAGARDATGGRRADGGGSVRRCSCRVDEARGGATWTLGSSASWRRRSTPASG